MTFSHFNRSIQSNESTNEQFKALKGSVIYYQRNCELIMPFFLRLQSCGRLDYAADANGNGNGDGNGNGNGNGNGATDQRVWDVSRLGGCKLAPSGRKNRSVEDILSGPSMESATSAHGYGSLERRRRRRPGSRAALTTSSARRVETDWEREEDDDDDVSAAVVDHDRRPAARKKEANAVDRSNNKLPAEWFEKKRANHQATNHATPERGHTPDWIHKIFHVARKGNLLNLVNTIYSLKKIVSIFKYNFQCLSVCDRGPFCKKGVLNSELCTILF